MDAYIASRCDQFLQDLETLVNLVFEPCRSTGQRVLQRKGVAGFDVLIV